MHRGLSPLVNASWRNSECHDTQHAYLLFQAEIAQRIAHPTLPAANEGRCLVVIEAELQIIFAEIVIDLTRRALESKMAMRTSGRSRMKSLLLRISCGISRFS